LGHHSHHHTPPSPACALQWENLLDPLERIADKHQRTWGIVSHLKGVKDNEALRKAVEEVQPENVKLGLRLSQSK